MAFLIYKIVYCSKNFSLNFFIQRIDELLKRFSTIFKFNKFNLIMIRQENSTLNNLKTLYSILKKNAIYRGSPKAKHNLIFLQSKFQLATNG